jgi:hypothetical protein
MVLEALIAYKTDIENKSFPGVEHTFEMSEEEWTAFEKALLRNE